ncbi:MAG: hypothetical protein ACT4QA_03985 [Panacagrimonas sp.]
MKPAARPIFLLLAPVALLGACVLSPQMPSGEAGAKCRAQYEVLDAKIEAAGVRDGQYYQIPDFPFMRSDRLMASFAQDLGDDREKLYNWIQYLRQNDNAAREIELINLGLSIGDRSDTLLNLRACSSWLVDLEMDDERWRQHLLDSVVPPDDYSTLKRALGLYPLTAPLIKRGIAAERAAMLSDYARPVESLDSPGPLILWQVKPTADPALVPRNFTDLLHDRLGLVGLQLSAWTALAEENAPLLWIESGGDHDRPGTPQLDASQPGVDIERPVVYWWASFARVGGRNLVQLYYVAWFSAHAPLGGADQYAGRLDGLIWRITLDPDGRALAYDSIPASGLGHTWFPVQKLERRPLDDYWQESPLFPQAQVPAGEVAIRVQSGSHRVRRVVDSAIASGEKREYQLRAFEDLFTLPSPKGGTRSLFDADGLVAGSERRERWWQWPSGVSSPGAMRQIGRHTTALVGREHFDDPFLFEKVFVSPFPPLADDVATQNPESRAQVP